MDITYEELRQRLVSAARTAANLDHQLAWTEGDPLVLMIDASDCVDAHMEVGAWIETSPAVLDPGGRVPQVVTGTLFSMSEGGIGRIDSPESADKPVVAVISAPLGMSAGMIRSSASALVEIVMPTWRSNNLVAAVVIRESRP